VISFRYHLVTIVAVFLALALGVLAGTTVVKQGLVKTLKDNGRRAEQQLADAQDQLSVLREARDRFLDWATPNRLLGQTVVVVTDDRADPSGARNAAEELTAAGADVISMTVTSLLIAEGEARALADLLDMSRDTPQATLVTATSVQLADRLAHGVEPAPGPSPTGPAAEPTDILVGLIQEGFVTSPDINPGDASNVGGPDQLMVVSAGGQATPGVPLNTFMRPLVDRLVEDGSTTAAVETRGTQEHPFVSLIRAEEDLPRDHLITVDNVELKEGRLALLLGLYRMVNGATGGDYGEKTGHDALIPSPP
jgi:hypothetical protein